MASPGVSNLFVACSRDIATSNRDLATRYIIARAFEVNAFDFPFAPGVALRQNFIIDNDSIFEFVFIRLDIVECEIDGYCEQTGVSSGKSFQSAIRNLCEHASGGDRACDGTESIAGGGWRRWTTSHFSLESRRF